MTQLPTIKPDVVSDGRLLRTTNPDGRDGNHRLFGAPIDDGSVVGRSAIGSGASKRPSKGVADSESTDGRVEGSSVFLPPLLFGRFSFVETVLDRLGPRDLGDSTWQRA